MNVAAFVAARKNEIQTFLSVLFTHPANKHHHGDDTRSGVASSEDHESSTSQRLPKQLGRCLYRRPASQNIPPHIQIQTAMAHLPQTVRKKLKRLALHRCDRAVMKKAASICRSAGGGGGSTKKIIAQWKLLSTRKRLYRRRHRRSAIKRRMMRRKLLQSGVPLKPRGIDHASSSSISERDSLIQKPRALILPSHAYLRPRFHFSKSRLMFPFSVASQCLNPSHITPEKTDDYDTLSDSYTMKAQRSLLPYGELISVGIAAQSTHKRWKRVLRATLTKRNSLTSCEDAGLLWDRSYALVFRITLQQQRLTVPQSSTAQQDVLALLQREFGFCFSLPSDVFETDCVPGSVRLQRCSGAHTLGGGGELPLQDMVSCILIRCGTNHDEWVLCLDVNPADISFLPQKLLGYVTHQEFSLPLLRSRQSCFCIQVSSLWLPSQTGCSRASWFTVVTSCGREADMNAAVTSVMNTAMKNVQKHFDVLVVSHVVHSSSSSSCRDGLPSETTSSVGNSHNGVALLGLAYIHVILLTRGRRSSKQEPNGDEISTTVEGENMIELEEEEESVRRQAFVMSRKLFRTLALSRELHLLCVGSMEVSMVHLQHCVPFSRNGDFRPAGFTFHVSGADAAPLMVVGSSDGGSGSSVAQPHRCKWMYSERFHVVSFVDGAAHRRGHLDPGCVIVRFTALTDPTVRVVKKHRRENNEFSGAPDPGTITSQVFGVVTSSSENLIFGRRIALVYLLPSSPHLLLQERSHSCTHHDAAVFITMSAATATKRLHAIVRPSSSALPQPRSSMSMRHVKKTAADNEEDLAGDQHERLKKTMRRSRSDPDGTPGKTTLTGNELSQLLSSGEGSEVQFLRRTEEV